MSAATVAPATPVASAAVPAQRFSWLVRAEFTKLRTLRSNAVAVVLALIGTVGVAALVCAEAAAHYTGAPGHEITDPTNLSLSGWYLTQLVIGVVAVLVVTSEFGSGMIRTTFAASPRRARVLAAKLLVVVATALVVSTVLSLASYFLGQRLLHSTGVQTTLGQPFVARAVFGAGIYITVMAAMGFGLGALVRNTAGAISSLFGVLFVPPILAEAFPPSWHNTIQNWSPLNAGTQVMNVVPTKGLAPWTGMAAVAVYAALVLVAGFVMTAGRDT